uniref:V-SNARE coiled-coil homology domain-containing protein n=1 Tax=Fagus sylvatica TaxID=28930 RepID=A0A2N9H7E9_FAGSY
MFAKRLLKKAVQLHQRKVQHGDLTAEDLDPRIAIHYGIPSTASVLAFDPIQRLLAIGTLDGRIKVIGGDGIEGLLISPKQMPYKNLEVWDLENRIIADSLQWASNITSFSVISGSHFIYIGDEHGLMSVMKFEAEDGKLFQLPYHISANSISGQILFVGGGKDLQLKDGAVDSSSEVDATLEHHLEEKEISALCWASSNGSILAVGYIDGDILFWDTSCAASIKSKQASSANNIVKLQLSSAERRLPVIVLQWTKNQTSRHDCDGQLFIYGGDEIGSEEVLTVITLEWSTGTLRCVGRADLTLTGSFADMILLPNAGPMGGNQKADLFVLTNPGKLHFYDDASLSALISQHERRPSISAMEFPAVVPSSNPSMTVAKLCRLPTGGDSSKALSEVASVTKLASKVTPVSAAKWPLTGGVASELSITKDDGFEQVYLAGYSDGSIRIWDATYPVLSLICLLEGEVQAVKVAGSSAPITKLDFCAITLSLAVGNECGLVRLFDLKGCSDFHFVTETKNEVHNLPQGKGPQCRAIFCLLNSPIQALQFANCGAKLAVGFESGRVAALDTSSLSVLFLIDAVSSSSSPIISMTWKELTDTHSLVKSPKHSETKVPVNSAEEVIFVLTKDAKINLFEGGTGNMISTRPWHLKKPAVAISIISVSESSNEMLPESHKDTATKKEHVSNSTTASINSHEGEQNPSSETACSEERLLDSILLVCCEDSLHLYSTKSVIQGNNKSIRKVKHAKPCCWTATLKKDEKVCGLVLLFQTGVIEIRSLPDLKLVKESSLMSILRWNFKANMDKTMSSSDNGQITLASGCELAFVSLLAGENDFRIPETLPCLHDNVLAAAADAALSFSINQKNKQGTKPGILGGIVKGFKGRKMAHTEDFIWNPKFNFSHLEGIFLKSPFPDPSPAVTDNQEAVELNIDDIEIDDEPLPVESTSSHEFQNIKIEKGTERERLFQGGTDDTKPRLRTPEEIMATYRKAGDASSVAAHARDKLVQRQEKLERISRRTEELQSGAEDFASLANELVKTLEGRNRKWWQI